MKKNTATAAAASASYRTRSLAKNDSNIDEITNNNLSIKKDSKIEEIAIAMGLPSNINAISHTTRSTLDANSSYKAIDQKHGPVYRSLAVQAPLAQVKGMDPHLRNFHSAPPFQQGKTVKENPGFVSFNTKQQQQIPQYIIKHDNAITTEEPRTKITSNNPTTSIIAGPTPLMLSEHTNTLVKGTIGDLAKTISDIFVDFDIDVEFINDKCKWSGSSYYKNRELIFRAVLYRSTNNPLDQIHVLEFQRRKGDFVQFLNLYQDVYEALLRAHKLCDKLGNILDEKSVTLGPRRSLELMPLPPGALKDFKLKVDAFTPLIEMAESEFVDVQSEAFREIANIASNENSRSVLGKHPGIFNVLINGVSSLDSDVRRCSCAAIEYFANDNKFRDEIVETGGIQKICNLLSIAQSEKIDRETQRVACHVASSLAPLYSENFYDCNGLRVFQNLRDNSSDIKIRQYAGSVCDCL